MTTEEILLYISQGRTDFILQLMKEPDWKELLQQGPIKPLQWLVYFNDTTGLKAVLEAGGTLDSININEELGNAAFFGHWKVCDFLINNGANVNAPADNRTKRNPASQCTRQSRQALLLLCSKATGRKRS